MTPSFVVKHKIELVSLNKNACMELMGTYTWLVAYNSSKTEDNFIFWGWHETVGAGMV